MRGARLSLFIAGAVLLAAGCRPLAKPGELVALEQLRKQPDYKQARKEKIDLVVQGEADYRRALAAWRDDQLRAARHHAVVSTTRLRMASALGEERALRARVTTLWAKLSKVQAEDAGVKDKLAQLDEMVQLYEELAVAQSSALEKKLHVNEVQEAAQAEKQLGQARLALKMAELVGAKRYARKLMTMAQTLLERADREFGEQRPTKAFTTAELASQKAQQAYATSRPYYLKEQAAAGRQAQNLALQKELASLAASSRWLSVKLVAQGKAQHLVLPVLSLFLPLSTKPQPDKRKLLDQIAERLKRFSSFHVVIRGHTSHRAPRAKRLKISRIRARKVADHFIAAGLSDKRFMVRGEGASRRIAPRRSTLNDRVELWILLR